MAKEKDQPAKNGDLEAMVRETHDKVNTLFTTLLGVPHTSDKGLCGRFEAHGCELFKLKRNFYILVGVLIGLGVITGGAYGAIELFSK